MKTVRFINNHAYFGAGVISADASMMLNGNSFYGNSANNGGAIETIRSFVAICNTFENNKAGLGGAISSVAGDSRLLYNKFLGNTANSGGAISSYRQTMFSMGNKYTKTSVNDTFVNGGFGGAIFVENGFMKSAFDTFGSNFAPRVSYTSFFTG